MAKREVTKAISFLPLSQIGNPISMVKAPGDKFSVEVTKTGRKVMKLYSDGVKRSATQYPKTKKIVETISY